MAIQVPDNTQNEEIFGFAPRQHPACDERSITHAFSNACKRAQRCRRFDTAGPLRDTSRGVAPNFTANREKNEQFM